MGVRPSESTDADWEIANSHVELSVELIDALASLLVTLEEEVGPDTAENNVN